MSQRGDAIVRLLATASPEEAVELLCEALDWAWVYLPPREWVDREAEGFRSVVGGRFPRFEGSPILSREACVAISEAARLMNKAKGL
jgi:hypothetical protein